MNDRLLEIFTAQRELMKQFHVVEAHNLGPFDSWINLKSCKGQARVRELASRVAIEVSEACNTQTLPECLEEVADVLHFLIELFISCGVAAGALIPKLASQADRLEIVFQEEVLMRALGELPYRSTCADLRVTWCGFTHALWSWCHQLKSKPWKLHPKETDVDKFLRDASGVFREFIRVCIALEITDKELYDAYFRKLRENQSRITSKA